MYFGYELGLWRCQFEVMSAYVTKEMLQDLFQNDLFVVNAQIVDFDIDLDGESLSIDEKLPFNV